MFSKNVGSTTDDTQLDQASAGGHGPPGSRSLNSDVATVAHAQALKMEKKDHSSLKTAGVVLGAAALGLGAGLLAARALHSDHEESDVQDIDNHLLDHDDDFLSVHDHKKGWEDLSDDGGHVSVGEALSLHGAEELDKRDSVYHEDAARGVD